MGNGKYPRPYDHIIGFTFQCLRYEYHYFLFKIIHFISDSEFSERFLNHANYNPYKSIYDKQASRCFDGTWVAAMAMNCTIRTLNETSTLIQPVII